MRYLAVVLALSMAFSAQARSLVGNWTLVQAQAAPWAGGAVNNLDYRGQRVVFGKTEVTGPGVLTCAQVRYAEISVPRAGLFMGSLPAPEGQAAAALGFTRAEVASVALSCSSGVFMYHFTPAGELKFAFDNTIWTLRRS
jgi:hypothetical protein